MAALQSALLQNSTFGQQMRARQDKVEAAARELQSLGKKLRQRTTMLRKILARRAKVK